ncbi:MAG: hypothetical protein ABIP71_04635 [Verrucomicrobiota bacterium]
MNGAPPQPLTWSLQRWALFFLLVFASQLLLIYFLSSRKNYSSPEPPLTRTMFQMVSGQSTEEKLLESVLGSDPTLFAMANPQGFSGAAWLNRTPRRYELSEKGETPFWLSLNSGHLGIAISQFVRSAVVAPISFERDSQPQIQITELSDPTVTTRSNSQFHIEESLATRLSTLPQLKSWTINEILSNTVAQVTVDQDGLVILALLLAKSGSSEADRSAMEIARRLPFLPVRTGGLASGKLIFKWHTVPVSGTNDVPKAAQP